MYIWLVFEGLIVQSETLDVFFKVLEWSLSWLQKGKWPTHWWTGAPIRNGQRGYAKRGTPLAGGYRAVLWCLQGDLDYFAKVLKLQHYNAAQPCCFCKANNSTLPWTDMSPEALWVPTVWRPRSWRLHMLGEAWLRLFRLPGASVAIVYGDWMHVKTLGTDKYLVGSALYLLVFVVLAGGS